MRLIGILLALTVLGACGDASGAPSATSPSVIVEQPIPATALATLAPTTLAPTTLAPTTLAPTTVAPPTVAPTAPQLVPPDAAAGTTAAVIPVRDDALVASATPVHVTEPCPPSTGAPDGTSAMQAELAKLEPMLGVVLTYGVQHKAEFGSYGLIWQGTNDASVFVAFTEHLDLHRDALNQLVEHPDELIVCQVPVSEDVGRALSAKLTDDLKGRFSSLGYGTAGVEIVLNRGEETLADELGAEYGEAIHVTICSDPARCNLTP